MLNLNVYAPPPSPALREKADLAFQSLMARGDLGFLQLPERSKLWLASQKRGDEILAAANQVCVVGIGGSSLGARAMADLSLDPSSILFFDSPDPKRFLLQWGHLKDLSQVHWLWVSKSGSTLETLSLLQIVLQHYKQRGLCLASQSTVIVDRKQSPLASWAAQEKVVCLDIPEDVGGRFSALTPAGLLPARLLGWDLDDLRKGALWGREQRELIGLLAALSLESFQRQEWVTLMWAYGDALMSSAYWWQQLWSESLAKAHSRLGQAAPRVSSPFVLQGVQDQHSLLQQVMEGERDKFIWFLSFEKSGPSADDLKIENMDYDWGWPLVKRSLSDIFEAERMATQTALKDQGVSLLDLKLSDSSPASFGAYVMVMEMLIGVLGELLEINAFDQPGVESGKKIVRKILAKPVV